MEQQWWIRRWARQGGSRRKAAALAARQELEKKRLAGRTVAFDLGAIEESDGEESDSEGEDEQDGVAPTVKDSDVPQAFSHFTYRASKRKLLVCDLQGVLNTAENLFELTDPVIHYRSRKGRKHVYGRTDHGRKGVDKFFCTHHCNALCRMLRMPGDKRRRAK